uniref:G-protein coupled receptors family 1 profile domain-containing protein n=1 Tax=Sinocyclocheilus grahami TaxID=75366 RepID=A0A672RJP7_SINGR
MRHVWVVCGIAKQCDVFHAQTVDSTVDGSLSVLMEFPNDSTGFADPRHFRLYNESLFQNNFSTFNGTESFFPKGVKITIAMVYMIVCVVGLVGNCLVMYVIIR